jgi:hypothetical protein
MAPVSVRLKHSLKLTSFALSRVKQSAAESFSGATRERTPPESALGRFRRPLEVAETDFGVGGTRLPAAAVNPHLNSKLDINCAEGLAEQRVNGQDVSATTKGELEKIAPASPPAFLHA